MKITIPLNITISLGQSPSAMTSAGQMSSAAQLAETEATRREIMVEDLYSRQGYDPEFLSLNDNSVELPALNDEGLAVVAPLEDGSHELKYHNFSIVMHKHRRLALYTAANVDWRTELREVDGAVPDRDQLNVGSVWREDPRICSTHQLPDRFFDDDRRGDPLVSSFDKGHLVERASVAWGDSFDEMAIANRNSFFTTNCSPQVKGFNRSAGETLNWRALEMMVQRPINLEKLCIFAGPVLRPEDPIFVGVDMAGSVRVKIPTAYWKLIVAKGEDGPEVFGFILEQDLSDTELEFTVPQQWAVHRREVEEIEDRLQGLLDLSWFKAFDRFEAT